MTRFYDDGHLTDEALTALILGTDADELGRLEMAEHLAFCDQCLQRYTDLLAAGTLLTPAKSCQESLWRRIRARTLHLLTSRYATAAAAVALALTVLWGGVGLSSRPAGGHPFFQQAGTAVTERLHSWPERWNDSMSGALSGLNDFFDTLGGGAPQSTQGGTHS